MTTQMPDDFAVFILTHGRPNNVKTISSLKKYGYTGKIFLVVDDQDKTLESYKQKFGAENVLVFSKSEIAKQFDTGDNSKAWGSVFFARNACFKLASDLGLKNFIQLDDDYLLFRYRFSNENRYSEKDVRSLDRVFQALIGFIENTPTKSICIAQSGDFIGGESGTMGASIFLKRKAMNAFVCSVRKPFSFLGRINEDVNTYVEKAKKGELFFTTNLVCLWQSKTQQNSGGMTELYLESGTYLKSFFSVMYQPSSVKVALLNTENPRLHHLISWNKTTPKILSESLRKP